MYGVTTVLCTRCVSIGRQRAGGGIHSVYNGSQIRNQRMMQWIILVCREKIHKDTPRNQRQTQKSCSFGGSFWEGGCLLLPFHVFAFLHLLLETVPLWQRIRREYEVPWYLSLHYLLSVLLITTPSPGNAFSLQGECIQKLCVMLGVPVVLCLWLYIYIYKQQALLREKRSTKQSFYNYII